MSNSDIKDTRKRLRFDKMFMEIVDISAKMSYCKRSQVGAVIVKDERVISNSWNGTISGAPSNDCEDENNNTLQEVFHAEENSILFAAKNGMSTEGTTLYCSLSPCINCSKQIIQSGIKRVVYKTTYRDLSGVELMLSNGVIVEQIEENVNE